MLGGAASGKRRERERDYDEELEPSDDIVELIKSALWL